MDERLQKNIEAFNSLVLCEVPLTEDLFQAPLHYVLGDFDIASLPHFRTLNAVIAAINPHGEVSIGIGFETYCRRIRAGIEACRNKESETISFMLPLWDEHSTHNFMMKVSHMGDKLGILFFYYDESGNSSGMDNMLASNFKDSLTGLFNRRTMKQHIIENHRDGYLCLFDLNKFKVINDTFGHGVGDDVLILVAKFLIGIASDKEVFYRRSGDEFMILFFGLDRDYAKGVLDRVEDYLEHLHENELKAYPTLRCGASFGVLELRYPDDEEPIDGDTEMKLTDLAMYQAKRAGKRYHFISHEDAVDIIKQGNLDERLNQLAASISR